MSDYNNYSDYENNSDSNNKEEFSSSHYDNDSSYYDEQKNNSKYEQIDSEQLLQDASSPQQEYYDYSNEQSYTYPEENQQPQSSGLSTASLVCGILGLVCCGLPLSIVAIILYFVDKGKNPVAPKTGLILGIIGAAISVLSIVGYVFTVFLSALLSLTL